MRSCEFVDSFVPTADHLYFSARLAVRAAGFLSHERSEYVSKSLCRNWVANIHEKELLQKICLELEWFPSNSDSLDLIQIFLYYIMREAEELNIAKSNQL